MCTDDIENGFLCMGYSQQSLRNAKGEKDNQMVRKMGIWLLKKQL